VSDFGQLLGTEVVGFKLTHLLGEGGMAAVFHGENVLNPRIHRAIKVVRPELSSRAEFRARFMEEAEILEGLRHANVVGFYGVREQDGWLVMELELLRGHPLSEEIKDGRALDVARCLDLIRQACDGVAAAHDLGIVHRDLKPDNLFVTDAAQVRVLDFGIARALDDADRLNKATVAGTVPGSPPYMAPEVCNGAVPATSADVYALGISVYELLMGHHPFQKPDAQPLSSTQMMFAHVKKELPPIASIRPDAPPALNQVIARAVAKDPSDRFTSARELADALRAIAQGIAASGAAGGAESATRFALPTFDGGGGGEAEGPGGTDPMRSVQKKRLSAPKVALALGLLGTIGVGGGVGYLMTRPEPAPPEVATEPAVLEVDAGPPEPEDAIPFVRVDPPRIDPRNPLYLGLPSNDRRRFRNVKGFRPGREIAPPTEPYEIHAHEVTWGVYEAWLKESGVEEFERPSHVPEDPELRANLPVSGIGWQPATDYCVAIGGSLPTEEHWEYAARGPALRPHAWGSQTLDLAMTHAFAGDEGVPVEVMSSPQDRTPGEESRVIFDLTGNVQEWTADLYRDDLPDRNESWVQEGGLTFRALRGLPLASDPPRRLPEFSGAHRNVLCATGDCPPAAAELGRFVGFRCVRPAREE